MYTKLIRAAAALTLAFSTVTVAEEKVLNIYNWSDYIDPAIITAFEKKTGVKVNYDVYDSNEVLEAKLMSGGSGYDIVVPTGAFLERHVKAGIYAPIDRSKLSNYSNLDTVLTGKISRHDPENKHNVPWAWGTIGLGYNEGMVKARLGDDVALDSLDLIFKPEMAAKLADCGIGILDSPAEVVSMALNYLGLDPNSEKKADLKKAAALLGSVRSSIKYFHSGKYISDLASGEICVALGYNGDILQAQRRAEEVKSEHRIGYRIPKEGALVWFDLMAIPADAPHPETAHLFIDHMLLPESSAGVANFVFFAVANKAAEPLIDKKVKDHPGIYPTEAVKANLFTQQAHTAKFDRALTRTWTKIKTGR